MKILFMCVMNSARSQLAEGLAKDIFGQFVEVQSAGSRPYKVDPLAIEVLKEVGIDISDHQSKTVDDLDPAFLMGLDYVITLCAEEVCPTLLSKAKKLHWPMPVPGNTVEHFRSTREKIKTKLIAFKLENNL